MQQRSDAWTKSDDEVLVTTVLLYIEEGETQLQAFEDVSKEIGRTPESVGFRWNKHIRKGYVEQIEEAKAKRKGHPKSIKYPKTQKTRQGKGESPKGSLQGGYDNPIKPESVNSDALKAVNYLSEVVQNYESQKAHTDDLEDKVEELENQLEEKDAQIKELNDQQDSFLELLEKARKHATQTDVNGNVSFKMSKNGNLERMG